MKNSIGTQKAADTHQSQGTWLCTQVVTLIYLSP